MLHFYTVLFFFRELYFSDIRADLDADETRCSRRQQTSPRCCHLANLTKYVSSLILAHWFHVKTWRHPKNRKYITYCTVVRGRPSHGHNVYRKFGEILTCGFETCKRIHRQTNKHTDRQADRNTTPIYIYRGQSNSVHTGDGPKTTFKIYIRIYKVSTQPFYTIKWNCFHHECS